MVISSEFRMGQYRDDEPREDVPHFIYKNFVKIVSTKFFVKIFDDLSPLL